MGQTTGPGYYKRGDIEPWDFIRDQGLSYHLGCAIKYIARAGHKESAEDDLKKAIHYLENELQHIKRQCNRISDSVWDPEQFGEPSYATGFNSRRISRIKEVAHDGRPRGDSKGVS